MIKQLQQQWRHNFAMNKSIKSHKRAENRKKKNWKKIDFVLAFIENISTHMSVGVRAYKICARHLTARKSIQRNSKLREVVHSSASWLTEWLAGC